jgi:hypothetical protein
MKTTEMDGIEGRCEPFAKRRARYSAVAVLGMAAVLSGCSASASLDESLGESQEASQCGPSLDFQDVELYNGNLGVTQAFVNLRQNPVGMQFIPAIGENCSGTLIARDLFLSAGHCGWAVGQQVHFDHQLNAAGVPRTPVVHSVTQVVEQQDNAGFGTFDYAVVRISGTPASTRGYTRLTRGEASIAGLLTIIQQPSLDGPNYKKVHTGPFVAGAPGAPFSSNWFRHQVDTLGASSGSGVLRRDGLLLGVHTHGGCNPSPPLEGNPAMRMSVLHDTSPILQQVASMQGLSFANVNTGGADAIVANYTAVSVAGSTGSAFGSPVSFTGGSFFGDRGSFFADVTGDGRADAIVVNNAGITVRRSNGSSFTANETWTTNGFFGDRGIFFADVTGDQRADAIVVNNNMIVVRRSNGSSFTANEVWTTTGFFGDHGTFFADVTGDGRADAIVVNNNMIVVRRSNGSSFTANEVWSTIGFLGEYGTFFADVTGGGRADAIVVTNNNIVVRRSNGTSFTGNEIWSVNPHFGNLGTHFADVTGDGAADAIAVNNNGVTVRPSFGAGFSGSTTWFGSALYGAL